MAVKIRLRRMGFKMPKIEMTEQSEDGKVIGKCKGAEIPGFH